MLHNQFEHKIMVVDNEPLVVEELVEYLQGKGYDCLGCVGPADALECFRNITEINIVLSDFRMPGMTGVQLVEAMKLAAGPARVFEAIIFTGNAETDDVIDALRVGVADYYQKPLNLELLLEGLGRVITKVNKRSAESKIKLLSQNLRMLSSSLSEICGGIGHGAVGDLALLGGGGLPPALDANLFNDKLSRRQKDVATLIARGMTNYQIACDLGISENTVKIYVSQILRIFNLSNRTQLALALDSNHDVSSEGVHSRAR